MIGAVVVCGSQGALAGDPKRATNTARPAASSPATQTTRVSAPTYFDISVPDARGGGVTVYRFQRATQRLTLLEHLSADVAGTRTATFSQLVHPASAIIVLSPEGEKKPPPPPPGGEDPYRWRVPTEEVQVAMQQLQALVASPGTVSIGLLPAAGLQAK